MLTSWRKNIPLKLLLLPDVSKTSETKELHCKIRLENVRHGLHLGSLLGIFMLAARKC
jgi:hypothetical protein